MVMVGPRIRRAIHGGGIIGKDCLLVVVIGSLGGIAVAWVDIAPMAVCSILIAPVIPKV